MSATIKSDNLIQIIKNKTHLNTKVIQNILKLLEEGCTIPFIARYRKDYTNNASDEVLRDFEEVFLYSKKLLNRCEEIIELLKQKEFLNEKILKALHEAQTLQELEDIYTPFKTKKSSRTSKAIQNGLEPLANMMQCFKYSKKEIEEKAKTFCNENIQDTNEAISGACDIIAQRYADDFKSKQIIRNIIENHGIIHTAKAKAFDENGVYASLIDSVEKIKYIKPHKVLAILRAVNEKQLSIKIDIDETRILENIKRYKIPKEANSSKELVFAAYKDGLKRLLLPSLKNEILSNLKESASLKAIELFGENLKQLLQTAPLVNHVILGMDPGYKTGCKLAVINEDGLFLDSGVIYPTKPKEDFKNAAEVLNRLISKYNITAIAIGNGSASKETASFISHFLKEHHLDIKYAVVSEIGASVYSASKIAQEEYPNLDVTIKGAISIAQRLRDPMAALVKIDAKSLGIGQYQHDLNQKALETKLENTTIDLVNKVGADLNSSSYKLLSFISGISVNLAKNIVKYREENGNFTSKKELLKVKGIGAKSFEQSVGFLRIKEGKTLLDNTGIHPEDYELVKALTQQYTIEQLQKNIKTICAHFEISVIKLQDIIKELEKPGFDIREDFNQVKFAQDIHSIEDLKEGFIVSGVVRNITDFGAFVDIGLKNDALLHISQISHKRIAHPSDVLYINQNLENIKIFSVDLEKQKVSLSLK